MGFPGGGGIRHSADSSELGVPNVCNTENFGQQVPLEKKFSGEPFLVVWHGAPASCEASLRRSLMAFTFRTIGRHVRKTNMFAHDVDSG